MPRTSLVDTKKAKAAVSILIPAPGLTVREAMILAKFTEEEAKTKSMQRKVSHDVQKKAATMTKAGATASAPESSPLPVESIDWDDDDSPNGIVSSMTEEEWKPKKHRLIAKQKQEKRKEYLRLQVKYSRAHKAATKLYATELDKGKEGMLSRKVGEAIKKKVQWSWSEPCNNSPLHGEPQQDYHVTPEKRSNRTYCGTCM